MRSRIVAAGKPEPKWCASPSAAMIVRDPSVRNRSKSFKFMTCVLPLAVT